MGVVRSPKDFVAGLMFVAIGGAIVIGGNCAPEQNAGDDVKDVGSDPAAKSLWAWLP